MGRWVVQRGWTAVTVTSTAHIAIMSVAGHQAVLLLLAVLQCSWCNVNGLAATSRAVVWQITPALSAIYRCVMTSLLSLCPVGYSQLLIINDARYFIVCSVNCNQLKHYDSLFPPINVSLQFQPSESVFWHKSSTSTNKKKVLKPSVSSFSRGILPCICPKSQIILIT